MKLKIISESPKETQEIASFFIKSVLKREPVSNKQAFVVSLEGDLGSGKTEFLKGVAKSLKLKEKVFSPTFLIMKSFPFSNKIKNSFKTLWHLDCYRLEKIKEIESLGFKEIISEPTNIIFIEWGNKVKKLLPLKHWKIKFKMLEQNTRILEFHIP